MLKIELFRAVRRTGFLRTIKRKGVIILYRIYSQLVYYVYIIIVSHKTVLNSVASLIFLLPEGKRKNDKG